MPSLVSRARGTRSSNVSLFFQFRWSLSAEPLPRSGTVGRMALEWRSNHAIALHAGLTRNVIAPWFPRSIDQVDGGFLCGFDRRWRPMGRQDRLLEFQA